MIRSITITDPLVKYQSLVARGIYMPDPAQHRLAVYLQKLYLRLKDYTPSEEYRTKLQRVTRAIDNARGDRSQELATESHPIWRNPIFSRFIKQKEGRDSRALVKVLTGPEAALHIDSPKGLFLSGDVGTGKSMLLDLLADALPTSRKKRWHYHTFTLRAFAAMEQFRKSSHSSAREEQEYSLLWMAREMVQTTPMLFLDEFQLPDRAASKLLNNLFLAFFQLGGVLVASSNRMPEELEKAAGISYSPATTGSFVSNLLQAGRERARGENFGQTSDFAVFLDVLKARCDFWHIEGTRDWRKRDGAFLPTRIELEGQSHKSQDGQGDRVMDSGCPAHYILSSDPNEAWTEATSKIKCSSTSCWSPATFIVYGRKLVVPRQQAGCASWRFVELVGSLGPADFLTLASNYHTFIIDEVPILELSMKNEARRFINLVDALYEARCKVVIRAAAPPDGLFFPDTRGPVVLGAPDEERSGIGRQEEQDATYSETIAEVFQDQISPFRPNVSEYSKDKRKRYDPDQDSDFGLETMTVDFGNSSAFTGEDERFAYKRASSRLWEMCSTHWHARTGNWWEPLPRDARHWESSEPSRPQNVRREPQSRTEIVVGPTVDIGEPAGLGRFSLAAMRKRQW